MKNSIKIMLIVMSFLNATIFSQSNESSELFNIFENRNFSPHRVGKNKITKKGIVEPAYKWPVGNNYN